MPCCGGLDTNRASHSPVTNHQLTVDLRSRQRYRSRLTRRQIQREVVRIALVHHFHPQVRTVENVRPRAHHTPLRVDDALVEVEPVQVERHRADAQRREPNANYRPRTQEEVQAPRVVEAGILENQPTKVPVRCHDVVGLFFLPKLVAIVLALVLGRLTHQRGGHQRPVHGAEQAAAEHPSNPQHVERVHQNVVLSLEHEHEVERAADAQGHPV